MMDLLGCFKKLQFYLPEEKKLVFFFQKSGGIMVEEGMATHSSILSLRIPWTEELGGLQSVGLQRVRHD